MSVGKGLPKLKKWPSVKAANFSCQTQEVGENPSSWGKDSVRKLGANGGEGGLRDNQ